LLPRLCSEKGEKDLLSNFWNEVVEGALQVLCVAHSCSEGADPRALHLSAGELFTSTHNTQYLAYQLVEQVLAHASAEQIPAVLTRVLIRRMLKESSGSPYMQAAAKQAVCVAAQSPFPAVWLDLRTIPVFCADRR
jgi:hypothetical protein